MLAFLVLWHLASCFSLTDPAATAIYTLSLHDALPISTPFRAASRRRARSSKARFSRWTAPGSRSEEHTSELQSHSDLVCRLLLEKKKNLLSSGGAVLVLCLLLSSLDTKPILLTK